MQYKLKPIGMVRYVFNQTEQSLRGLGMFKHGLAYDLRL